MDKELFISHLLKTNRKNIENVIQELESIGFFSAPASIKYQNNYPGGLAEHSYSVYKCALDLRRECLVSHPDLASRLPEDSITIAALLHDVCKSDVYHRKDNGKFYKNISGFPCGHGEKSVIMLLRMGLELTDDEILAIRWHMGGHETRATGQEHENLLKAQEKCLLLKILQKADGLATRQQIERQKKHGSH